MRDETTAVRRTADIGVGDIGVGDIGVGVGVGDGVDCAGATPIGRARRALAGLALAALVAAAPDAGSAIGGSREQILAALDDVAGAASRDLELEVSGVRDGALRLGEPVSFRLAAKRDGYLAILYVDQNGVGTLLYPAGDPESARLAAGAEKHIPPDGSDTELEASLPLGQETVFAILAPEPLPLRQLGVSAAGADYVLLEPADTHALAQRLSRWAREGPAGSIAVARADHRIEPSATRGTTYTAEEIVTYFETTRSLKRPQLDLNVKFPFGSTQLTEQARRDLDEVGKALNDATLVAGRFQLAGHTDDVGDEAYNQKLSTDRAEAVRRYLASEHSVEASRLAAMGYGESAPEVEGQSEEARARNRRVVLQRLR